jgi:hypothetical protein
MRRTAIMRFGRDASLRLQSGGDSFAVPLELPAAASGV